MKKIYTIIIFLLTVFTANAAVSSDSLKRIKKDSVFILHPSFDDVLLYMEPTDILDEGMLLSSLSAADSIQFYITQAQAAIQKVRELNNYIDRIDPSSKFQLPVGIKKEVGGIKYEMAIQAIRLKPAYAELDVFMQFEIPQNGQVLSFMAKNIKFTMKGGIVGNATLQLLGDYAINMNGDKSQIILKGGKTFASIDCDGFKELGIDADVKFSRDLIRPEKLDGSVAEGNVVGSFTTTITDWNNLVVELSLPTFQMNGLSGISFAVQGVVFDFSDTRNATNIQFPEGYQSTQMLPGNANLWRGFYMRELTIKLPSEFKKRGTTERTTLLATNVIIDNMGLTGKFKGTSLITLQQGDMNGWAFSLNELNIELQANQLVQAGFKGNIVIPVSNEKTPFEYSAIINPGGSYVFSVSPSKDISFDVFSAAHVDIYESSYLEITIADHKFLPKANLNGRMAISAKLGGKGVELANITFESLEIQAVKPYIKVGNFSFGSEAAQQAMAGFPVSIHDIGLKSYSDTEVGLDFNLKLNLVGESNGAFAADAGLTVVGTMDAEKGLQSWHYKTVRVREISVDIDGGAYKINGKLIFYRNDATYGDGSNGVVKAEFTPGIKVAATAIFGSVKGLRYWYADAMVNFPVAIPIFPAVGIYGFGGGAFFAMKMDTKGEGSELGKTASGVVYVPDEKAGLGLKAIINLGSMPKPEAFNADLTFEISFFKGGGVRYIAFGGNGYLVTPGLDLDLDKMKGAVGKMTDVVKTASDKVGSATKGLLASGSDDNSMSNIFGEIGDKAGQKGQISARMMITFDFENHVLHGNFEVYVNVAGGIIKGVGPGGRAGWSVLHFAPHEWYIYAGTPDDRVGISIGVGSVQLAATSYFMVGTKILGSPPPPPEVARILGMSSDQLNYMKDLNSLGTGAGFAFGAALSFSTGELNFLMFYSSFSAGLGFDIMLKNYGEVYCKGSDKRLGVNGWYANGQAYAYFEGAIGINVKVFGKHKKIEILSIGAATVMQAKLPNPFWMRGIVGGHFSVLGGMVKGNCKFEVTIGKECEPIKDRNAILNEVKIISALTPANGESDVNVFNTPQAVFNVPVNKVFELVDEVNNAKRKFRVKLDKFELSVGDQPLTGTLKWNDNQDVVAFDSYEVFPSKKDIKILAQVSFEEDKNGSWSPVITSGQPVVERMEQKFTSGVAPDYIPTENIAYSYPVTGQMNFYKDESSEGYIKLIKGQSYLFNPGVEWKQLGRFSATDGVSKAYFDFAYSESSNTVNFSIPGGGLKTNQLYTMELVNIPAQKAAAIDRNVSQVTNKVEGGDGALTDTEITTKKAEGSIDELQEKSIYTSYLRSSAYPTFVSKMNAMNYSPGWTWILSVGVHELGTSLTGATEYFAKHELTKEVNIEDSFVKFEADLSDNTWYTNSVYPLVYSGYPFYPKLILDRHENPLGIPPVRGVYIRQSPSDIVLQRDNPSASSSAISSLQGVSLVYNLPQEMYHDYINLRIKAADLSITNVKDRINYFIITPFPILKPGFYKVKAQYYLPGINKMTSEKLITINYTF